MGDGGTDGRDARLARLRLLLGGTTARLRVTAATTGQKDAGSVLFLFYIKSVSWKKENLGVRAHTGPRPGSPCGESFVLQRRREKSEEERLKKGLTVPARRRSKRAMATMASRVRCPRGQLADENGHPTDTLSGAGRVVEPRNPPELPYPTPLPLFCQGVGQKGRAVLAGALALATLSNSRRKISMWRSMSSLNFLATIGGK